MSYQVDQVEVTPVDIAPERKKPGKIAGILAKIRGLFDDQMAPPAQPQLIEVTDEAEWKRITARVREKMQNKGLTADQFREIVVKSSWDPLVIQETALKLDETLTFNQVSEIAEQTNWDTNVVSALLSHISRTLTLDQVLEIAERMNWNESIVSRALNSLDENLTLEQVLKIVERTKQDPYVIFDAFSKMNTILSLDQVFEIAKQMNWDANIVYKALSKIDETLSLDQVFEIARQTNWEVFAVSQALRFFGGSLSLEEFLEIAEQTKWHDIPINTALKKFNGPFSVEQFFELANKTDWNSLIVQEASQLLNGTLSVAQLTEMAERSRWDFVVLRAVVLRLGENLPLEKFFEIAEHAHWNSDVVWQALSKTEGSLSVQQLLDVSNKSRWNFLVINEALRKLDGILSIDQFIVLATNSDYHYAIVEAAFKRTSKSLSLDQVLELVQKADYRYHVVNLAFERIDKTLTLEEFLNFAVGSNYNYKIVHKAFEMLFGTFSFDQFLEVAKKSNWNSNFVSLMITKLAEHLSVEQFIEIAEHSNWDASFVYAASKRLDANLSGEIVLRIISDGKLSTFQVGEIISRLLNDTLHTSFDFTELVSELTQKYPGVLLVNLERFGINDTMQLATTLINKGEHALVLEHLAHFPQKDWAEIIKLLMKEHQLEKYYLTPLLPYIDYIDEQTKKDIISRLLQSPLTAFLPELLENETPRAIGQFGSFRKEDQQNKLAQLKEGRFYKALLVLSKAYGYSAEQIGFTFEGILSEIKNLISNNNDKHLFDLISLAVLLFPEKEIELQNIRETFSTQNSSPTEEMKPRESFTQFDALKEIFEYYAMITLEGRYNIDLLSHSLTSRITDKINTLYEKIKEYIVIAVSSELRHSGGFGSRMFGNHGNYLYKFGTPEDIRIFFERAKIDFPKEPNYPNTGFGGPSWATIADFGAQFWADSAQNDLNTKITLLNLAVSLQHNTGYFFDKDNRIKIENLDLKKLLDFEAGGERTFESFLAYGLENHVITQEEYAEYVQLNNTLSSATEQLPTRVDSNKIYLKQMVQEAKKQIEAIQNNPTIPFEIKMEAQAVFSKTEGFSRKENYRLYLSNLLKTISVNWENIDDTIKRFQSGNQVIYSVSIAGYDLAYWYEDGKLITIHSMDELKQQRQKLSQFLNQPIVAAQFGYVREGD